MKLIIGCNNPYTGVFTGDFNQLHLTQKTGIDVMLFSHLGDAYPIEYYRSKNQVIIARKVLEYKAIRTWPGSWSADEMVISDKDGIRLLKHLKGLGFDIEEVSVPNEMDLPDNMDELITLMATPLTEGNSDGQDKDDSLNLQGEAVDEVTK